MFHEPLAAVDDEDAGKPTLGNKNAPSIQRMPPASREERDQPSLTALPLWTDAPLIGTHRRTPSRTPWDSALSDWVPRQQSADLSSHHLASSLFDVTRKLSSGTGKSLEKQDLSRRKSGENKVSN